MRGSTVALLGVGLGLGRCALPGPAQTTVVGMQPPMPVQTIALPAPPPPRDGGAADAPTARLAPRPLSPQRHLFWSKGSKLVAVVEYGGCGLPGPPPNDHCVVAPPHVRVVEPGRPERVQLIPAQEVFGFRADGETLVIKQGDALVDWSTRTRQGKISEFDQPARGAATICLSPDDDHFVAVDGNGRVSLRSRTAAASVSLDSIWGDLTECSFSPSASGLALASDKDVFTFTAAELREPEAYPGMHPGIPVPAPGVSHLAWSSDDRFLSFSVIDAPPTTAFGIFYIWEPDRSAGTVLRHVAAGLEGALDLDMKRRQIVGRVNCAWSRSRFNGTRIESVRDKGDCFHVRVHEVAVSPDGKYVAAAEGEWGGSQLVLKKLD
jgi:hypothetical protein